MKSFGIFGVKEPSGGSDWEHLCGVGSGILEPQRLHGQQRTVLWDLAALTGKNRGHHLLQRLFFAHSSVLQVRRCSMSVMWLPLSSGLGKQKVKRYAVHPSHSCKGSCEFLEDFPQPPPPQNLLVMSREGIESRRKQGFWEPCGWRLRQRKAA